MAQDIVTVNFSLTPNEVKIIDRVNLDRALLNRSAALRQIIREWNEMQTNGAHQPAQNPTQTIQDNRPIAAA